VSVDTRFLTDVLTDYSLTGLFKLSRAEAKEMLKSEVEVSDDEHSGSIIECSAKDELDYTLLAFVFYITILLF